MIHCPICKNELLPGDKIYAEWYEPCRWFVLHHTRQGEDWCAEADHPSVDVLTRAFRESEATWVHADDATRKT